jgi:hypothetical protein
MRRCLATELTICRHLQQLAHTLGGCRIIRRITTPTPTLPQRIRHLLRMGRLQARIRWNILLFITTTITTHMLQSILRRQHMPDWEIRQASSWFCLFCWLLFLAPVSRSFAASIKHNMTVRFGGYGLVAFFSFNLDK